MTQKFLFLLWTMGFVFSQNVGIGTAVPDASAKLEIYSTNSGLLVPRMTTTQRDAIPSPASSLLIFNTTTNCYEWWDALGQKWVSMSCGCSVPLPSAPTATSATNITASAFDANWNAVAGASTYYLDVATDNTFTAFVSGYNNLNVGSVLTQNVSGLSCGTTYYYRVRAENSCGTSRNSNVITVNTSACPTTFCLAIGGNSYETGNGITRTSDGGYVIAAQTRSFGAGNQDMYIVKLDGAGTLLWTKTIGGSNDERGWAIIETSDGGLAIAGYTRSYGAGGGDMYVVKLNASGNLLWTRTIGGTSLDDAMAIIETSDGGLAIAGYTHSYGAGGSDMYVVKLNASGNLLWTRTIGGSGYDDARAIVETSDGGLVIAGHTQSYGAGAGDVYLVKLSSSGNILWTRTIGGSGNDYMWSGLVETSDNGLVIAGFTDSYGAGSFDVYVVKFNASGNLLWTRTIGGSGSEQSCFIIETSDQGLVAVGSTSSYGSGGDMYLVKFNASGSLLWTRTVGGNSYENARSVVEDGSGYLVLAGYTYSYGAGNNDVYVVKLDASGNLSCTSGCRVNSGGVTGSGGVVGSGGLVGSGGTVSSGGVTGSGGTLVNICGP